ncbi:hypothetical protein K3495_g9061 [Podosphaera aphanis]|nr:hypothetical protein K3495_g9061 [Podosphaera aphanis]
MPESYDRQQSIDSADPREPSRRHRHISTTSSTGFRSFATGRNIAALLQRKKRCSTTTTSTCQSPQNRLSKAPSEDIFGPPPNDASAEERSERESNDLLVTDDEREGSEQSFNSGSTPTSPKDENSNEGNDHPSLLVEDTREARSQSEDDSDVPIQEKPVPEDSSDGSDEDFQYDSREADNKERIPRNQPTLSSRRPSPSTSDTNLQLVHEERDKDEDTDESMNLSKINRYAKRNTAMLKEKKPPKSRTTWSENDTISLIEGIEKFGCSWSNILTFTKWETERNQVALKDKARNLKVNLLKSGAMLPKNFDKVRLGKKEIEAVKVVISDYKQDDNK